MHRSQVQPGRETKERDKLLQHKLVELNSHVQRLERCMAMLRAENDVLRKKQSDQRSLEEKVRMLRKRNANLAVSSRRLEERVRLLQDRANRNQNIQNTKSVNQERSEISSRRRTQTRQVSNPHTTYRRAAGDRGRDIDNLHRKCQKLSDLLNNADVMTSQKCNQLEENQELVEIIKVAAKERLQLEHELAASRMKTGDHVTGLDPECAALSPDASNIRHSPRCQQRLSRLLAENQQLRHTISCLREQAEAPAKIPEECTTLKLSLATAQREKEEAEKEAQYLGRRVHSLENVVRDLQESAEHVTQLENQRKTALQQLQQKQAQLNHLQQVTSTIESTHTQKLSSLNQQLVETEEKLRLEEETRLKLVQEVQRLQKEAAEREKVAAELEQARLELSRLHCEISTQPGEEMSTEISLEVSRLSWNQQEQNDDSLMSQWARNGPIQVYVAKYNYDPFQLSPNENPEAELALIAGDYVLVVGDMDEDGFFDGELIDGSQGLVPSNFIEKVKDEDLCLFHEVLLHAGHRSHRLTTDSKLSNYNNNHTVHTPAAESSPITHSGTSNDLHVPNNKDSSYITADTENKKDYSHATKVTHDMKDVNGNSHSDPNSSSLSDHGNIFGHSPPCPRNLWLDQHLSHSVDISWTAPDPCPGFQVHCYHVLVDGHTQAVVGGSERTKVTLAEIDVSKTCRVCVRCLSNRGQSRDAQCTMLVGKDADPVPTELTVVHVSPTLAILTWLPGNSNYQHSVSVNGQEVAVVRPGVFYHILSDLQAGTLYQVTVRIKSASGVFNNITSPSQLQHVSTSIQFSTPLTDPAVETEARLHSPPLMKEVCEHGVSLSARQLVSQHVDSVDGEEQKGLETDEEIEEAFRQVEDLNEAVDGLSESSCTNSSRTELSDIPELEEDLLGSQDSQLNQAGASKVASKSPQWKVARPTHSETDDQPREFHAEKPAQFDGKPLVAPTPHTPTIMQNHVTQVAPASVEEANHPSLHNTPTNVYREQSSPSQQPAEDIHVSTAFIKMELTQQKNMVNRLHLVSVGGNQCVHCEDPQQTHKMPPGVSDPANLLSDHPQLDLIKETPPDKLTESDTHPGSDKLTESDTHPGSDKLTESDTHPGSDKLTESDTHPGSDKLTESDTHPGSDKLTESDTHPGSDKLTESDTHPGPDKLTESDTHPGSDKLTESDTHPGSDKLTESDTHPGNHVIKLPTPSFTPPDSSDDPGEVSREVSPVVKANSVRLFIALYDYHPATMSPNVECVDEELSFREGQILKVFGHKDADGFYKGESNGIMGYIPCNLVCEVQIDDPNLRQQLLQDIAGIPGETHAVQCQQSSDSPVVTNGMDSSVATKDILGTKMIAMYDYDPHELSPNTDAELELPLTAGDVVTIYGDIDEDGFFTAEINNKHGLVPSNFLQPLPSINYRVSPTSCRELEMTWSQVDPALNGYKDKSWEALYLSDQINSQAKQSRSDSSQAHSTRSEDTQSTAPVDKPKRWGLFSGGKIFKMFA